MNEEFLFRLDAIPFWRESRKYLPAAAADADEKKKTRATTMLASGRLSHSFARETGDFHFPRRIRSRREPDLE